MSVSVNFVPGVDEKSEFPNLVTVSDKADGIQEFLDSNPTDAVLPLTALQSVSGSIQSLTGQVVKYFFDAVSKDAGNGRRRIELFDYVSGMSPSRFAKRNRWIIEYGEDEDPRNLVLGVFGRTTVGSDDTSPDIVRYLEGTYTGRGLQAIADGGEMVLDVLVWDAVPKNVDPALYDVDPLVSFTLTKF